MLRKRIISTFKQQFLEAFICKCEAFLEANERLDNRYLKKKKKKNEAKSIDCNIPNAIHAWKYKWNYSHNGHRRTRLIQFRENRQFIGLTSESEYIQGQF